MKNEIDLEEINVFEIEIHPLANVYRMHDEEEYADLLESVRNNGVRDSVAVAIENDTYYLIDGRNRVQAARECGIEHVQYFIMDDMPINDYIHMVHTRRNPNKSQLAMADALLYPKGRKRGQKGNFGNNSRKSNLQVVDSNTEIKTGNDSRKSYDEKFGFWARYLIGGDPKKPAYPQLVEDVKWGRKSCKKAYQEAKEIEATYKFEKTMLDELRDGAYDLYCKVVDESEDLRKMHKEMQIREKEEYTSRRSMYKICKNLNSLLIFKHKAQRDALRQNLMPGEFISEVDKDYEEWKKDVEVVIRALNKFLNGN